MFKFSSVILLVLALLAFDLGDGSGILNKKVSDTPPKFLSSYKVTGTISLPYAEIKEPFIAYFDPSQDRSRIDYYGDACLTYQLGKEGSVGTSYKITYYTMDTQKIYNQRTCFKAAGQEGQAGVHSQPSIPDMTNFTLVGDDKSVDGKVEVWQKVDKIGTKINRYMMWVTYDKSGNPSPQRYMMFGLDTLYGSHFDKYYVDYDSYGPLPSNLDDIFTVPKNIPCHGFPGPGKEHFVSNNPMSEIMTADYSHIDGLFDRYQIEHRKLYKSPQEAEQRKRNFHHNYRYVESKNRQRLTFTLAVNHLADRTPEELKYMLGKLPTEGYNGGAPFDIDAYKMKVKDLPPSMDWRLYGAVTPVKDQAICGSCWSFGTTGTLEGTYFLKTGQLVRLSEQELMDCSWGEGNNACDGGEDFRAYQWITRNGGISATSSYGPYLGQDGKCKSHEMPKMVNIKSYVNVTSGDQNALKMAIFQHGPISVSIDAALRSFSFYANGVFYDPACGNKLEDLDHSVLAVGYGTMNGQDYWLIKNSWSTYWGNDGYVLLSLKDNNCGVATQPTFTVM